MPKIEDMESFNYTIHLELEAIPKTIFQCIGKVQNWWAGHTKGDSENLGSVFTVYFGSTFSKFEIIHFHEFEKIIWTVKDSNLNWLVNKQEWNGTQVVWNIRDMGSHFRLEMIHLGINPEVECFDQCSRGWNFYIGESLRQLILSGKGLPDTPQTIRRPH